MKNLKDKCDFLFNESLSKEELLLCLKRVEKSIKNWTKHGGRHGYSNFVRPHLLLKEKPVVIYAGDLVSD